MPRCPRCGLTKPASEFVKNRANTSGFHTYCKPCQNTKVKTSIEEHHGSTRQRQLRRRYGLDEAQVAWFLLRQDQKCAVCGAADPAHVDHDHLTGGVRGVLCFNCNGALGKMSDRVEVLRNAADYLEAVTADEGTDAR